MPENVPAKTYTIGVFAKITGTTERTLRFYDRKGLLKPSGRNAQGHRFYMEEDLLQLQRILTLKYLDFSLDDIAEQLQAPGRDLAETLNLQYVLLKQKQQQLEKVLGTLDRMRKLLDGAGGIDSSLLLFFIHSIQNEEAQKQYLARQLPPSVVDAMFMENVSETSRLEMERDMTAVLIELTGYCREGRSPEDPEVLQCGIKLAAFIEELLGTALEGLDEQQLRQFEQVIGNPDLTMDPALFYNGFTKEEELFLAQVMERLEVLKPFWEKGGEADGR